MEEYIKITADSPAWDCSQGYRLHMEIPAATYSELQELADWLDARAWSDAATAIREHPMYGNDPVTPHTRHKNDTTYNHPNETLNQDYTHTATNHHTAQSTDHPHPTHNPSTHPSPSE